MEKYAEERGANPPLRKRQRTSATAGVPVNGGSDDELESEPELLSEDEDETFPDFDELMPILASPEFFTDAFSEENGVVSSCSTGDQDIFCTWISTVNKLTFHDEDMTCFQHAAATACIGSADAPTTTPKRKYSYPRKPDDRDHHRPADTRPTGPLRCPNAGCSSVCYTSRVHQRHLLICPVSPEKLALASLRSISIQDTPTPTSEPGSRRGLVDAYMTEQIRRCSYLFLCSY